MNDEPVTPGPANDERHPLERGTAAPDEAVDDRQNAELSTLRTEIRRSFSGPLPSPDILQEYDDVIPGAAERIIQAFEAQSSHRRDIEGHAVRAEFSNQRLGIAVGGTVAVAGFMTVGAIAIWGSSVAAAVVGIAEIVALAGAFIYGTERRRSERIEKARIMTGADADPDPEE